MCMLNLNFKILGEILVYHTGGSIIFDNMQAESEVYNFEQYLTLILKLRLCLHVVKDDWPPQYDRPGPHLEF